MTNMTGIRPLGESVLCIPYEPEFDHSVIAIPDTVREVTLMQEMRGIVIALGPDVWSGKTRRADVGDKVLISRWAGVIVKSPTNGKLYRLCHCDDIFAGIEGDMRDVVIERKQAAPTAQRIARG